MIDSRAADSTPAAEPQAAPVAGEPLARALLSVRWGDLDAYGHVNNAAYLTYLEESRLRWFETLPGDWYQEASAPVLASSLLEFRQSINWPEELIVELRAPRLGNSSLTLTHRILSARDASTLYLDATTVMVWIDRASGRSVPLPDAVRQAVSPAAARTRDQPPGFDDSVVD